MSNIEWIDSRSEGKAFIFSTIFDLFEKKNFIWTPERFGSFKIEQIYKIKQFKQLKYNLKICAFFYIYRTLVITYGCTRKIKFVRFNNPQTQNSYFCTLTFSACISVSSKNFYLIVFCLKILQKYQKLSRFWLFSASKTSNLFNTLSQI